MARFCLSAGFVVVVSLASAQANELPDAIKQSGALHLTVNATDPCGKKIGTTRSTSFPAEIDKWSKQACEGAGKPAAQYVPGENSIDVRNQLKQGRIDAAVQGSETLPYAQQQESGKYRIIGE